MIADIIHTDKKTLTIRICQNIDLDSGESKFGFIADDESYRYCEFDFNSKNELFKSFSSKEKLIKHVVKFFAFESFNFFDDKGKLDLPKNRDIKVLGHNK